LKLLKYIFILCFYFQASAQVNLQSGLIGYYNFNANGYDSSGYNHHAIVKGEEFVEDRFGHPCNALRLNGDGQYVEFPKIISLENPEWSYSIWFKLEQLPYNKDDAFLLTYKNIISGDDVHLYVDNDDNNIKIWNAITGDKTSTGVEVFQNIWYHVVLTSANGHIVQVYVNGSLKISQYINYSSTGSSLMISSNYSASTIKGRVWGVIDAVRFYNRPVNSQEALALYQFIEIDTACNPEPVITEPVFEVNIPNVFTPNSDGSNDEFKITGNGIISLEIKIYNRWGTLIFESDKIDAGWNGTTKFENKEASDGVYFYILQIRTKENGKEIIKDYKGTLSLIK
jgi:gliding motility-associated-like protein